MLLEGLEALKASVPPERYWPDLALTQMQQRLRKGLIDGTPRPALRHYFPDDDGLVERVAPRLVRRLRGSMSTGNA